MRPKNLIYVGLFSMACGAFLAGFLKQKFIGDTIGGIGITCLIFGIVRSMDSGKEP